MSLPVRLTWETVPIRLPSGQKRLATVLGHFLTVTAFIQLFVSKEISLEVGREAYLYTTINKISPTIIPRVRRSLSSIIYYYDILS